MKYTLATSVDEFFAFLRGTIVKVSSKIGKTWAGLIFELAHALIRLISLFWLNAGTIFHALLVWFEIVIVALTSTVNEFLTFLRCSVVKVTFERRVARSFVHFHQTRIRLDKSYLNVQKIKRKLATRSCLNKGTIEW